MVISVSDLGEMLRKKLAEAFAEQWDPLRPTRVEIIEEDDLVGLRLLAMDGDGGWHTVHQEPPLVLTSYAEVDDLLARSLSIFLMEHPRWPK